MLCRKQTKAKGLQETDKKKGFAKPSLQFSGFILICAGEKMHEVFYAAESLIIWKATLGRFPTFLKFYTANKAIMVM